MTKIITGNNHVGGKKHRMLPNFWPVLHVFWHINMNMAVDFLENINMLPFLIVYGISFYFENFLSSFFPLKSNPFFFFRSRGPLAGLRG